MQPDAGAPEQRRERITVDADVDGQAVGNAEALGQVPQRSHTRLVVGIAAGADESKLHAAPQLRPGRQELGKGAQL